MGFVISKYKGFWDHTTEKKILYHDVNGHIGPSGYWTMVVLLCAPWPIRNAFLAITKKSKQPIGRS